MSASQYFSFPRASVAGGVYKYRPRSEAPCTEYMSSCIVRVHTRTAFHYCCADQQLSHCYQDQQIRCNCPCRTPCIGKRTCPMLTPVSRQLISRTRSVLSACSTTSLLPRSTGSNYLRISFVQLMFLCNSYEQRRPQESHGVSP